MKYSESFIYTQREAPKIAECQSHKLLLRAGFLTMVSSGIYAYLPLGYRVLNNINRIIRKYMDKAGAQELFMSALQPIDIWQKTGRDKDLKDVMFTFEDRKKRKLCLGPTHEEEITEIARRFLFSHKQLPCTLYQIQTKFRDEPRPRFGLMRSCEFIMKDAYSFDRDQAGLDLSYEKMLTAYKNIFRDFGLDFVISEADSGAMGGSVSHEFMVEAAIGEDMLYRCPKENKFYKDTRICPVCKGKLKESKFVELGHVFQLGTKYSLAQEGLFLDENGSRLPFVMGCYGIGVSRVLSAIAEVSSDKKGLIWPKQVAPYDLTLIVLADEHRISALNIADKLNDLGISVLVDERNEAAGVKFNDAYLIGNPYIAVMGKKYSSHKSLDLEVRSNKESKEFTAESLISFLKDEYAG
ncbi:MAG: proline--tRNA ligase [Candidatus Omnitrophica bacterium]|nr:proline--tRNA ligase [Candidatus Omnitrophota bacterium]